MTSIVDSSIVDVYSRVTTELGYGTENKKNVIGNKSVAHKQREFLLSCGMDGKRLRHALCNISIYKYVPVYSDKTL